MARRLLRVGVLAVGLVLGSGVVAEARVFPQKYDQEIRRAAKRYLPSVPWRLVKAQLYQESRLDPQARSPVGAEGLGQFMQPAWSECQQALTFQAARTVERWAIECSAWYMSRLRLRWDGAQEWDLHNLALAGYNAGNGNISRAHRACGEPLTWEGTAICLPRITGRHSQETIVYVERVWQWFEMMELGR